MPIPVIDLFAGPGGLGEGFSSIRPGHDPAFKIRLSVEMDLWAHQTLLLRAFYRQFDPANVPPSYYQYLRGKLASRDELENKFKTEFAAARNEAWRATLGVNDPVEVSQRIFAALGPDRDEWLLIGGPPCQAYSTVGRSRIIGQKGRREYERDHRHFLYREYLRIIAKHQPAVFVMENVTGLLSANINGHGMFPLIREDLQDPLRVFPDLRAGSRRKNLNYSLFSIAVPRDLTGDFESTDFIVRCENYGIPQARHRIIILGIRDAITISRKPGLLRPASPPTVSDVIGDLPKLRSGLSKGDDTPELWKNAILGLDRLRFSDDTGVHDGVRSALRSYFPRLTATLHRGGPFVPCSPAPRQHAKWFVDSRLGGACNHETRLHMPEDLQRYFFAAVFARTSHPPRSPRLVDFPEALLPRHKNVDEALTGSKFNDRFRVQLPGQPSTTIVSHISKDGHYYIHYDPAQCRSLTVREAARLQTFPDNYFFEGPRTEQYHQVGNAVPPLLARQIAAIVFDLFH